jgi:hypothetical protein
MTLFEGLERHIIGFIWAYYRDWRGIFEGLNWHIRGIGDAY